MTAAIAPQVMMNMPAPQIAPPVYLPINLPPVAAQMDDKIAAASVQPKPLPEISMKLQKADKWCQGVSTWVQNGSMLVYVTNKVVEFVQGPKDIHSIISVLYVVNKSTKKLESIVKEGKLASLTIQNGKIKAVAFHAFQKQFIEAEKYSQYYAITEEGSGKCTSLSPSVLVVKTTDSFYKEIAEKARQLQK